MCYKKEFIIKTTLIIVLTIMLFGCSLEPEELQSIETESVRAFQPGVIASAPGLTYLQSAKGEDKALVLFSSLNSEGEEVLGGCVVDSSTGGAAGDVFSLGRCRFQGGQFMVKSCASGNLGAVIWQNIPRGVMLAIVDLAQARVLEEFSLTEGPGAGGDDGLNVCVTGNKVIPIWMQRKDKYIDDEYVDTLIFGKFQIFTNTPGGIEPGEVNFVYAVSEYTSDRMWPLRMAARGNRCLVTWTREDIENFVRLEGRLIDLDNGVCLGHGLQISRANLGFNNSPEIAIMGDYAYVSWTYDEYLIGVYNKLRKIHMPTGQMEEEIVLFQQQYGRSYSSVQLVPLEDKLFFSWVEKEWHSADPWSYFMGGCMQPGTEGLTEIRPYVSDTCVEGDFSLKSQGNKVLLAWRLEFSMDRGIIIEDGRVTDFYDPLFCGDLDHGILLFSRGPLVIYGDGFNLIGDWLS